jgi:hypothetical protein
MIDRNYLAAETNLKEALKILKNAQQEKSLGYSYLLRRYDRISQYFSLAFATFKGNNYSEAEKYFKVNI